MHMKDENWETRDAMSFWRGCRIHCGGDIGCGAA
jgi:hypothetical protein